MNTQKLATLAVTVATVAFSANASGCSTGQIIEDRALRATSGQKGQIYEYESDGGGFNTKNFFYDNGEEVVAFDTQFTPENAEKSIAFLRTKTKNPITYVVLTHPNPDKFNGMSVFQKLGAKVIASVKTAENLKGTHEYKKFFFVNMAKMFTEESYPKLSQVDITFEQNTDLRLKNGEVISLRELSRAGVSTNQTIALVNSMNAVFVGDLVHTNAHAWLEGGIVNGKATPTLSDWISDLKELQASFKDEPQTLAYGGRGDAAAVVKAVSAQIEYLNRAEEIVSSYIKGLGERRSELLGDQANGHYQAIQGLFEKAFPAYRLGYMIQYGVYGLVNSKL